MNINKESIKKLFYKDGEFRPEAIIAGGGLAFAILSFAGTQIKFAFIDSEIKSMKKIISDVHKEILVNNTLWYGNDCGLREAIYRICDVLEKDNPGLKQSVYAASTAIIKSAEADADAIKNMSISVF